jgi:peptidoglycan/LPS O-acetylase OafA/YrhL
LSTTLTSGEEITVDDRPSWQRRKIGYLPALDGLRAVAVILVFGYHLGYSGMAGGYVGVEMFFVLSGWLVCALLVNERHRTGAIRTGQFWLRRARRLLPAMVITVAGTLIVAAAVQPDRVADLRREAFAALTYHLNWQLILDHRSYFAAADGPSALEHLWSLSIEEQFYLVFPLLCGLVLVRGARSRAVKIALAGALAATVWRLALHDPHGDPTRLWFGTDTRAAGLFLGVALAMVWTPNRLRPHAARAFTAVLDGVAVAAAVVVGWYALSVSERDPTAFGWGLTLVDVATLALIAVAVYPAPTGTVWLLSRGPLRWVGRRSYGIYLIHWPVIVFLARAPGEQPASPQRTMAMVALVLALSALSFRYVEEPIRRQGLVAAARERSARLGRAAQGRPVVAAGLAATAVVLVGTVMAVTHDVATATAPETGAGRSVRIVPGGTTTMATADPAPTTTAVPRPASVALAAPTTVPPTTAPAPPAPALPTVTAIGDSVMAGAADALAARLGGNLSIDAQVGRQLVEGDEVVDDFRARGALGRVVVIQLGANGPFTPEQIDELFVAIGGDHTVMLINVEVPRRWEGEVNDQLVAARDRHPGTILVDWRAVATTEPGLTGGDGYHLTPAGAERYADEIVANLPAG